jgi:predicted negative regulator of RcsB-dependent stress response
MRMTSLGGLRALVVACCAGGIVDVALAQTASAPAVAAWQACRTMPDRACILAEALASANGMANRWERVDALDEIARAQAKLGMRQATAATIDRILEIMNTLNTGVGASHGFVRLAATQAKAGMTAEAFANLDRARAVATPSPYHQRALFAIARGFAKAGNVDRAMEVTRTTDESVWPYLFLAIAEAQGEAGKSSGRTQYIISSYKQKKVANNDLHKAIIRANHQRVWINCQRKLTDFHVSHRNQSASLKLPKHENS